MIDPQIPRPGLCLALLGGLAGSACTTEAQKVFDPVAPFAEIEVEFTHRWDESTHPFSGAAVVDVDGDGLMEVFVGGGKGQDDALLVYRDGRLVDLIAGTGLSSQVATYGSVSIDIDNDDDIDLLVARDDGVYLYRNAGGKFTRSMIPLSLPQDSVPFSIAVGDIDRDGLADLYISVFVDFASFRSAVYNDPEHAKSNLLLLNNGDGSFSDITARAGVGGRQNSFVAVFTDLDLDGWQDLVVAQNTGEVEIFRNDGNLAFTAIETATGYGFWMGLALGDIDRDGDQDLFFSNVGDSIPAFLTSGDLRDDQRHELDWLLLRNDGAMHFTDVSRDYAIIDEGFGWGGVFEDLNLDGQLDLVVAQNYIKWPLHRLFKLPGRTYLQHPQGGRFIHVQALGIENSDFGQVPLIADLDANGKPDLVWINMDGPARAFLNRSGGNAFRVSVPDKAALLGTRVTIETDRGRSYTREVVTGIGLMSDQTPDFVFGLAAGEKVLRVIIDRPGRASESFPASGQKFRLQPPQ